MKLKFTWRIFEKKRKNLKFHENPSSGSRVVPCGQMAEHDEANGRLSLVWERASWD